MFLIPGEAIALLTFPGVMLHELAHQIGCWLAGVKVYKVCYFRLSNPCGYVIHEHPKHIYQSLAIVIAPIVLGYSMAIILALIANDVGAGIVGGIILWLSFSIAMNALSSNDDINSLWGMLKGFTIIEHEGAYYKIPYSSPLIYRIILFPFGGLIKLINTLRLLWSDAIISYFIIVPIVKWFN